MRSNFFILLFLLICGSLAAQYPGPLPDEIPAGYFSSPIKHTPRFGGNFAELRNNHFHAGIDLKSSAGAVGDSLFAVADGYIRRLKVQRSSYGQTIYIDHPEVQLTSVYAHVDAFRADLTRYVREQQWEKEEFEIDLYPDSIQFPISKGDFIGTMGNKGHSYGPHLHFELRTLDTEIPVNPIYFGFGPTDSKHPVITAVKVENLGQTPRTDGGIVLKLNKGEHHHYTSNDVELEGWTAGLSVGVYDQQDGSWNKNGIYQLTTIVDGDTLYSFVASHCSFEETGMINAHVNYPERMYRNRFLHRCYRLPGNMLSMYKKMNNNGRIALYQDRWRAVTISAKDWHGNESTVQFRIKRKAADTQEIGNRFHAIFDHEKANIFSLGDFVLSSDSNSGIHPHEIKMEYVLEEGYLKTLQIGKGHFFLKKPYTLSVPTRYIEEHDLNWTHLEVLDPRKKVWKSQGKPGREENRILFSMKTLGKMRINVDSIGPEITPVSIPKSIQSGKAIKFKIKDNTKCSSRRDQIRIKVFLNGQWIFHEFDAKNDMLIIPSPERYLQPTKNLIRIEATDFLGNKNHYEIAF